MSTSSIQPIILAAGRGTRLESDLPKALAPLNGKPLIEYGLTTLKQTPFLPPIVVVGHEKAMVSAALPSQVIVVDQGELKGTGHAVLQALPAVPEAAKALLVLMVDMPLWQPITLVALADKHQSEQAILTLALVDDASEATAQFGRVLLDDSGRPRHVVEVKNATNAELKATTRNAGLYVVDKQFAAKELPTIEPDPVTDEIYLPVLLDRAIEQALPISTSVVPVWEATGINTLSHLAEAEKILKQNKSNV